MISQRLILSKRAWYKEYCKIRKFYQRNKSLIASFTRIHQSMNSFIKLLRELVFFPRLRCVFRRRNQKWMILTQYNNIPLTSNAYIS